MSYSIEREIARFRQVTRVRSAAVSIAPVCEHGLLVTPRHGELLSAEGKSVTLALLGITHGNEWACIAVINQILARILAGAVPLMTSVAFLLGNPAAAQQNRRFLERDLNRSFNRQQTGLREEQRALELAGVLRDTSYLVDFHQVTRKSDRPFFIFPYNPRSYAFARAIGPRHTVVTHWGKPFSNEGMCSDEFVISCGGTGISFELGQNGFDHYQIAVGVNAGLEAIRVVGELLGEGQARDPLALAPEETGELYTWAEIVAWPETGYVELRPEWNNFDCIEQGESLGTIDGKQMPAHHAGRILFPKYLTRDEQAKLTSRPTELIRIMRPISSADLP